MYVGGALPLAPPALAVEGPRAWAATCRGPSWPPIPLGRQGNEVATGEHGERCRGVVPRVEPLLPPPLQ
jgi:hypothetical protein